MKKIVIIPTYNERENVEAIVRAVIKLQQGFHVLIIDDGSPDGTGEIVKGLVNEFGGQLFLEERKGLKVYWKGLNKSFCVKRKPAPLLEGLQKQRSDPLKVYEMRQYHQQVQG